MKILHLTINKKWFDMILLGEKKEEYREMKPYWVERLCNRHIGSIGGDFMDAHKVIAYKFKHFDAVEFRNGYSKDCRSLVILFEGISIGFPISGLSEEGWLDTNVFKIRLGNLLSTTNCSREIKIEVNNPELCQNK